MVVRSTWDYVPRRREYLAWADRVAGVTTLANPADVLRWNTDKRYLADLAAAGVPWSPRRSWLRVRVRRRCWRPCPTTVSSW